MIEPNCHICRSSTRFLMKKDGFDEYMCNSCKISFVHPQPNAEWLKDKVYSYESGYQGNKRTDLSKYHLDKRTDLALKYLVHERPGGVMLDVGCSNGLLMYWAKNSGLVPSGVEINKRTADMAAANGFRVHQGFIETCPFAKASFDIVYLGDVIEHVNDPHKFVVACTSFLKNDGLMAISTPNVDCWWSRTTLAMYRIFGIPWSSATPPHHLFQFSESNLSLLMKEHGFEPIKSIFTGPSSLKYELGSLHLLGAWKRDRKVTRLLFMAFSFMVYTLVFTLAKIFRPLQKRRFEMVMIYKKC